MGVGRRQALGARQQRAGSGRQGRPVAFEAGLSHADRGFSEWSGGPARGRRPPCRLGPPPRWCAPGGLSPWLQAVEEGHGSLRQEPYPHRPPHLWLPQPPTQKDPRPLASRWVCAAPPPGRREPALTIPGGLRGQGGGILRGQAARRRGQVSPRVLAGQRALGACWGGSAEREAQEEGDSSLKLGAHSWECRVRRPEDQAR